MSTGPASGDSAPDYGVELLFQAPPTLSSDELLKAFGEHCGGVEAAEPEPGSDLTFTFPDIQDLSRADGKPVQLVLTVRKERIPEAEADDALLQTRDWAESREAVRRHTALVSVSDRRAAGLPYKNRLRLFQDALVAIFECAAPVAIYWKPTGKIVNPVALQKTLQNGKADPLHGALNVRCMPASRPPGAQIVDTLGMAALGLPDLECTFKGNDPAKMSALLRAIAKYMFDLGDVIEEGRIFRGAAPGERWACTRTQSSEPPARPVIRLKPA